MSDWSNGVGTFLAHAYDFFRPTGSALSWGRVVWEQWSLPKHSFILWLAVLGKLRTRDRLRFIAIDPTCMFCRHEEESHSHLFFAYDWTGRLWAKIKSWLRIGRRMLTLNSAIRGLHTQRCNIESRMRRVSLAITVYLIWEERNKRVFDGKSRGVDTVFKRFQILFYIVFHFHEKDHFQLHVGWSSQHGWALCCRHTFSGSPSVGSCLQLVVAVFYMVLIQFFMVLRFHANRSPSRTCLHGEVLTM